MTKEELNQLRTSNEAPFNHQDYTFWLHQQIFEKIVIELQNLSNQYDVIDGQYVIRKHDFDALIENFKHNS